MLASNVDAKAKREVIKGFEHAIKVKTTLQDNFKEQALEGITRLYRLYGAPNVSLYLACEQGIVWVVREAIYEGREIVVDAYGRPRIAELEKKTGLYKTTASYERGGSVVRRLHSMSIQNQDYDVVDGSEEPSDKSALSSSSPFRLLQKVERKKVSLYDVEWRETGSGRTALHVAAKCGQVAHFHVCKHLIRCGWDPSSMDSSGQTPVDVASKEGGNPRIAEMLWAARSSDEVPSIEICCGKDQRPRHRPVRYSASAWQLLLERIGGGNDILSDPESEEEQVEGSAGETEEVAVEEEGGTVDGATVAESDGLVNTLDPGVEAPPPAINTTAEAAGLEAPPPTTDLTLAGAAMGAPPAIDKPPEEPGAAEQARKSLLVVDDRGDDPPPGAATEGKADGEDGSERPNETPSKKKKGRKAKEKKKKKGPTINYKLEDSVPATEDQNLALYWVAYGLREDLVSAAVEDGVELFYLNSAWGHWQKRKRLNPIHYDRKWCNGRGWTALHGMCTRKGPFDETTNNTAMNVCRTLVNGGWDPCKFSNSGDGFSPVDLAERNKSGKVAVILHTLMPHGHKSVVWKSKQGQLRDFVTSSRAATAEENLFLCWCARGWTGGEEDDDRCFDKYVPPETEEAPVAFSNLAAKEEEENRLIAEKEAWEKMLEDNPFVLPAHEGPHAYEDQCAKRQRRRQWLGNCLLAAVLHGYQLHYDKGIMKCRPVRPIIDYDPSFTEENGFSALHTAAFRKRRNIVGALISAGWDPSRQVMRTGKFVLSNAAKVAEMGGDGVMCAGLNLVMSRELIDFAEWMIYSKEREVALRIAKEEERKRLAEVEAARVASILKVMYSVGLPKKGFGEAFMETCKPVGIADLLSVTKAQLLSIGIKSNLAATISRKLQNNRKVRNAAIERKKLEDKEKEVLDNWKP
jgi:ankyrin repeat protein